jgi:predicted RNA polymerase sigma factor
MVRRIRNGLAPNAAVDVAQPSFKSVYEHAEHRRGALLQRLSGLNASARAHPAYRRSLTLLNQTFRKATVAQRLATLQAAEWLIDVLERLSNML